MGAAIFVEKYRVYCNSIILIWVINAHTPCVDCVQLIMIGRWHFKDHIYFNALRLRPNGPNFADQIIFKSISFKRNFCILISISLKKVPEGFIEEKPALVLILAWRRIKGLLRYISFILWWGNPLWRSDTKWPQRSGSTLAQVMACCLTAPSHYLNLCWLIISKVKCHSSEDNFTRESWATNQ